MKCTQRNNCATNNESVDQDPSHWKIPERQFILPHVHCPHEKFLYTLAGIEFRFTSEI